MPPMPAPEPASEELTYQDYCEIPEDGLRQVVLAGNLHRFGRRGFELSRQDRLETPLLPGFTAELAEVFDPGLEAGDTPGDPEPPATEEDPTT